MKFVAGTMIAILLIMISISSCTDGCNGLGEEYDYTLLRDQSDRALGKFSWDMRIDKPISKAQIEVNARILKCQKPGYNNYYISYFLPGYELNAGAWATAHFTPDLNVEILELQ